MEIEVACIYNSPCSDPRDISEMMEVEKNLVYKLAIVSGHLFLCIDPRVRKLLSSIIKSSARLLV